MRVVNADVRELDERGFDRALVDAPCSGLGVLARRPDLRWRAKPLPELQLELLQAAAERTKPGGTIVYSVCTLNADENEAVVDASGLEVEPLGEEWPQYAHPTRPEFLLTRPDRDRTSRLLHRPRCACRKIGAVPWRDWIRTVEVEPSLYGADFARLGDQIDALLDAGCRVFHFDVGDGHFVEPVTMGPIVLQSIAPLVHARGGAIDVPPDGRRPGEVLRRDRGSGRRQRHVPLRGRRRRRSDDRAAREQGLQVGVAFNPETEPERRRRGRRRCRPRPLHGDPSRLLGPAVPRGDARAASRGCAPLLPGRDPDPGRRRRRATTTSRQLREARRDALRRGVVDLRARRSAARLPPSSCTRSREHLARASSSRAPRAAARIRSRRSAPSSSRDGEVVGEGVTEAGGRHGEVVALDAAGERARGATLYVTLEPCAHHGTTPPCTDAILAAGVARVVFGVARPEPGGGGRARSGCARRASTSSSSTRSRRAR